LHGFYENKYGFSPYKVLWNTGRANMLVDTWVSQPHITWKVVRAHQAFHHRDCRACITGVTHGCHHIYRQCKLDGRVVVKQRGRQDLPFPCTIASPVWAPILTPFHVLWCNLCGAANGKHVEIFIARGTRAILLVKKRPTFFFDWLRRFCSNVTYHLAYNIKSRCSRDLPFGV